MIELLISSASRIGCVRHNNEDMVLVGDRFVRDADCRTNVTLGDCDRCILAVADGMGGHRRGEVASEDTLRHLQFFFNDLPAGLDPGAFNEMIVEWLEYVNMVIDSKGAVDPQYKGMGTTLVALAYYEGEFYSMNCGDSRLYSFRDGRLRQLTVDHSLSQLRGDSHRSSIITNCIGGGCSGSYIDLVRITDDVRSGDTFLLCSDGLTDMVPDPLLQQLLADGKDADALCDEAIALGGYDNVSVCLLRLTPLPLTPQP